MNRNRTERPTAVTVGVLCILERSPSWTPTPVS